MNRLRPFLLPLLTMCVAVPAQRAAVGEPVDAKAVEFLRREGLDNSQVMDHLSWICDVHGPRLTGSPGMRRAQAWAVKTLQEWGLANVHTERFGPFGRGWQCDRISVHVVGDNPWPVIAYPKAWSPSRASDRGWWRRAWRPSALSPEASTRRLPR